MCTSLKSLPLTNTTNTNRSKGELEHKQQNGHVLNANQLNKIKGKQALQHKLDQIANGSFAYEQHPSQPQPIKQSNDSLPVKRMQHHATNTTIHKSRSHSLPLHPLKKHQIRRVIDDTRSALDINEKFEKLLSRPTYSIWAVRELLASLSDDEWKLLPTEYIRHILDAYYTRNDIVFVHKILMKWFPTKLGHRYVLYNDLCRAQIDANNLKQSLEVFEYLLHSLMVTARSHTEQVSMLLYIIYDIMKVLIPKIISLGQFHIFDTLLTKLIELKEHGFIDNEAIHNAFSNQNLALLFQTCVDNESLHRLLIITKWINEQNNTSELNEGFLNVLEYGYVIKALVLAINGNNNALFMEILKLCRNKIDIKDREFEQTIIYCIEHKLLHCILNDDTYWSLGQIIDLQEVQLRDTKYFNDIVKTYCRSNLGRNKLGITSWDTVCDWLLSAIAKEECISDEFLLIINKLMYHFVVTECFESLLLENMGDATRWDDLIYKLLTNIHFSGNSSHVEHNGIICALQIMAYLKNGEALNKIINNLPDEWMERYCIDVIDCCVCDEIQLLYFDEQTKIFAVKIKCSHENTDIIYIKRAFHTLQMLDEIHAVHNIENKGWIEGEKRFRTQLQHKLQEMNKIVDIDLNMDVNAAISMDSVNGTTVEDDNRYKMTKHKQHEMKWFDALSRLAFEQK